MPLKKRKRVLKKNNKPKKSGMFFFICIFLLIGLTVGMYVEYMFKFIEKDNLQPVKIENKQVFIREPNTAYIQVPAVDNNGNGVSTVLAVKAEPGTGRTKVDIDSLLFWVDTQNSIRIARRVAENVTNVSADNYDMTFSILANASLIGGESAGAALTLASIAALSGEELNQDFMITGTINHDGSIGPIGGVLEKASAAKDIGATKFFVPLLQSDEITYDESEHCETFGLMEWCTTERIPKRVQVGDVSGIEVIEVGNIRDAYNYFKLS